MSSSEIQTLVDQITILEAEIQLKNREIWRLKEQLQSKCKHDFRGAGTTRSYIGRGQYVNQGQNANCTICGARSNLMFAC